MRFLTRHDEARYGCPWCADMQEKTLKEEPDSTYRKKHRTCPYDECAYGAELEKYPSFLAYDRALEKKSPFYGLMLK